MADKGIIYMNINALSKYIISFLFAGLVVLSVLLAIYHAENKALNKANAVLKEQVALRDTAINEIDKNIKSLQQQVLEAEQICNERLKARNDVLMLLNKDSPQTIQPATSIKKEQANSWKGLQSPVQPTFLFPSDLVGKRSSSLESTRPFQLPRFQGQVTQKRGSASLEQGLNIGGIMDYEKSNIVIDSINSYWVRYIAQSSNSKK